MIVFRYAVDGMEVLLALFRGVDGLPEGTTAMSSKPDHIPDYCPLVLPRRIGGASNEPRFLSHWLVNVQCYVGPDVPGGNERAAYDLADHVTRVLFESWRLQTVTPYGHIVDCNESLGPQYIPDVDLPRFGRTVATYNLHIRSPRGG